MHTNIHTYIHTYINNTVSAALIFARRCSNSVHATCLSSLITCRLVDTEDDVRAEAALALSFFKIPDDPQTLQALARSLCDTHDKVRSAVWACLGQSEAGREHVVASLVQGIPAHDLSIQARLCVRGCLVQMYLVAFCVCACHRFYSRATTQAA